MPARRPYDRNCICRHAKEQHRRLPSYQRGSCRKCDCREFRPRFKEGMRRRDIGNTGPLTDTGG